MSTGLLFFPLSFYLLDVWVLVYFKLDHVVLPVVHLEHGVFESVPASHLEHHSVFLGNLAEKAALDLLVLLVFNDDVQEFVDLVGFSNNFGDDASWDFAFGHGLDILELEDRNGLGDVVGGSWKVEVALQFVLLVGNGLSDHAVDGGLHFIDPVEFEGIGSLVYLDILGHELNDGVGLYLAA